jgi:D-alanyl-D-alanine carboxypeptidase
MKKFIYILSFILMLEIISVPISAQTKENSNVVNIVGESAIVIDIDSGETLYEKNATTERYPASITKIMTALVVLENRELSDKIHYKYEALCSIESGSSAAYIQADEVLTVEQSLYIMMLHSANDVAHGLAYDVGGNLEGFSKLMNQKAVELGCEKTHFVNASGLTAKDHYTTAADMAKIAKAAYENKTLRKIMGTEKYVIPATNKNKDMRTWVNGNRMIREGTKYYNTACLGGKTGYTIAAGGTLVTYAKIKDHVVACVILKSQNSATAYEDSAKLYNFVKDYVDFTVVENDSEKEITSVEEIDTVINEIEKIIYPSPKSILVKIIYGIKIACTLIILSCVSLVLYIIYVQYVNRKKRRRRRKRIKR